jgi:hypothetical protein
MTEDGKPLEALLQDAARARRLAFVRDTKPVIDHGPIKIGKFGALATKKHCVECPLARASEPGRLGGYTVQQYLDVLHGVADLACHLSPGFPRNLAEQRSCTGVAMFRNHTGIPAQGHATESAAESMARVGENTDLVFASDAEFAEHHKPPQTCIQGLTERAAVVTLRPLRGYKPHNAAYINATRITPGSGNS